MKHGIWRTVTASVLVVCSWPAIAKDNQTKQTQVLFQNVQIFNGTELRLSTPTNVLVEGNLITAIGRDARAGERAIVIDGGGRVLMPGMSDTHVHLTFASIPAEKLMNGLVGYAYVRSTVDAEKMLMHGLTTVRDMAGPVFGLKEAIDEGLVPGPRIYPSGGMISQTSGHFDFRSPNQKHPDFGGPRHILDIENFGTVVDGVPQVLAAVRENLRHGASQIKLAAGGGYGSPSDPLESTQFTYEELKAAVDAAADWGTYVTVHAYHPRAINRAIDAGVKDVGHGQLLDEPTLRRMAKEGVFLSTQPFTESHEPQLSDFSNSKLAIVSAGTAKVYQIAKTIPNLKVTWGTDVFNYPEGVDNMVKWMERLLPWYSPGEILIMATGNAGELYKMSGPLVNPYPDGDLGVVKVGAYADLLLVEGNPLDDLKSVTEHDNLRIIMKDGKIYKNTIE